MQMVKSRYVFLLMQMVKAGSFFLLMQMVTAGSVFLLDGKGKTRSGRLDTAFSRLSWAPLDSFTKF